MSAATLNPFNWTMFVHTADLPCTVYGKTAQTIIGDGNFCAGWTPTGPFLPLWAAKVPDLPTFEHFYQSKTSRFVVIWNLISCTDFFFAHQQLTVRHWSITSARLSVQCWYIVKAVIRIVKRSAWSGRGIILVSWGQQPLQISEGNINRAKNKWEVENCVRFPTEIAIWLGNGTNRPKGRTIFDDFDWPWKAGLERSIFFRRISSTYVRTVWPATMKFGMLTHAERGMVFRVLLAGQPRLHPKVRSPGAVNFLGL